MMISRSFGWAMAGLSAVCAGTLGQQIPPPEGGAKVVTAKLVGNEVEMRDAANGAPIMIPKGIALWEDKNNANNLPPVVTFQAQPTGFDVIYTFDNKGQGSRKLGALNLGIFTLGHRVDYPDLRLICEPAYADYNEGYKVRQMNYPDTIYSPAWILKTEDYAVGMTIQYPILEYKHDVRLCLITPEGKYDDGEGGRGWRMEFLLSNVGTETEDNKLRNSGLIGPGEKRTYVVSVRVTKTPDEWVRTMVPYRNWFRGKYGGVAYERQPRCINGRSCSTEELCTDQNPLGFGDARQDLLGWGNFITTLLERHDWDTIIFWTPSGSYRYNTQNNMPFQVATNWKATPALATATDPLVGFPRLPAAGQKIGFWWGRSVQVADKWDDDALVPFDVKNMNHRNRAFAEMDMAVAAGATTVGMDTYCVKHVPLWDLVDWTLQLKARYPGVRFCAEPVNCDLIHREIPTYFRGAKDRWEIEDPDQINGFTNPHYLADFLLPGHEIWGGFRWSAYETFGIFYTDEEKTEHLREIAALGYVPCATQYFVLGDPNIEAAESWKYTVPPDLRIDEDAVGSPSGLAVVESPPGVAGLTWIDNASNEKGFRVERKTWLGNAWSGPTFVANLGVDAESFNNVPPSGAHMYRVRAFNDAEDSEWTAFAACPPARPTAFDLVKVNGAVRLEWTDRSNFESQFSIQREQRIDGVWTGLKTIATLGKNANAYPDAPGLGTWHYRIRAGNVAGASEWTLWRQVTLP